MSFYEALTRIAGGDACRCNEPMKNYTTFRIGGEADYVVMPKDLGVLTGVLSLCAKENMPVTIVGNGSNLLVGDGGIRGVVIRICGNMDYFEVLDESENSGKKQVLVKAGAGMLLSRFANTVSKMGYTGMEYAAGIPGTLGGGIVMNAGAYGGEIKDSLVSATVLWLSVGNTGIEEVTNEELKLGYRTSRLQSETGIVLDATFSLEEGDADAIQEQIRTLNQQRREKQPLEYPSAGSTFKRPEGYFAGKLIQDAGLKGFCVGGAQVSEKHSGFVINKGDATAAQVRDLIRQVDERVYEQFGVHLEPEVRMVGEF